VDWKTLHEWVRAKQWQAAQDQEWDAVPRFCDSLTDGGKELAMVDCALVEDVLEEVRQWHVKGQRENS